MTLEARGLSYGYGPGGPLAVEDLSFVLGPGEVLGLAGPSGSGKSTLLGLLKGYLQPRAGFVLLDGQAEALPRGRNRGKLRDTVGLAFQYPERQLFSSTLAADLAFGLRRRGIAGAEVDYQVDAALDQVGLAPATFRDRSPFGLSGGERRRAALAAILVMEPQVLLLDEPTAGLDAEAAATILSLVASLAADGAGVILATHEADDLLFHTSRLLVLDGGRQVASGSTLDLLAEEEGPGCASFLDSPRLGLLRSLGARGFRGGLKASPAEAAAFSRGEGRG